MSDWSLLWSTITVISPSPRLAVGWSDSQNWPSCSSPSPVSTKTGPLRPGEPVGEHEALAPSRSPMPSEPVLVTHLGRRQHVGVAGQAAEAAQPVEQVEVAAGRAPISTA